MSTFPHDALHGNSNDAIRAIEGELGLNPSGTHSTVKARLDSLDVLTTPSSGTLASGAISYQRVGTGTGAMVFVWTTGGWNAATVTLPVGFRPAAIVTTPGRNSGGTTDVVVINTTGTIQAAISGLGFTASFAAA